MRIMILNKEQKRRQMKWSYGIGVVWLTMEAGFQISQMAGGRPVSALMTWIPLLSGIAFLAQGVILERQLQKDNGQHH